MPEEQATQAASQAAPDGQYVPRGTTAGMRGSHPNIRSGSTAQCYGRGYHVANWGLDGNHGNCLDCGSDGSDHIPMHDVLTEKPKAPTHRPVAYGPDDFAARMRERMREPGERQAPTSTDTSVIPLTPEIAALAFEQYLTRDRYISLADRFGIKIDSADHAHSVHFGDHVALLERQNQALLERAQMAEASSAAAQRECQELSVRVAALEDELERRDKREQPQPSEGDPEPSARQASQSEAAQPQEAS